MKNKTHTTLLIVILSGCGIAMVAFGIRSIMGLYVDPITESFAFRRDQLGFTFALQNLFWGATQPFAGALADRFGTARTICVGILIYALGLGLMALSSEAWMLYLTGGILMGAGIAFSSFTLVLSAFARLLPKEKRVLGFGLGTAAGSAGQLFFAPIGLALIERVGWQSSVTILGAFLLALMPLTFFIRGKNSEMIEDNHPKEVIGDNHSKESHIGMGQILAKAFSTPSYKLLVAGFFVCGFHVAFITVHMPSFLVEKGISLSVATWALALIGGFNIIGSLISGAYSNVRSKKQALAFIYFTRSITIIAFISIPIQPWTVIIFSICMGLLWLSTVPPTNGLVLTMFGPRYLSTLFGFVFFSHQIGSFLGIYIGGIGYEYFGSYDIVWYLGILFGFLAAFIHLPIKEKPVALA